MPRSSKHKTSKHSSRDTREYSDSDKDSILKDRKGKDESIVKVSKDSSSSEKRKLDSKDGKEVHCSGNGECSDEYISSKRRKERSNDGVEDRWNGGDEDRGEGSRKSKTSGDSKSRRRDESVGLYGEGRELKKSSGKSDGKHKDSGRKESREGGAAKDRKFKGERTVDNEEQRMSKQEFENTDLRGLEEVRSPELDNQLERQMRKKRDDSGGGDKHQDDVRDGYDRRMSSRDDIAKDGRQKDEKRKDEKYRDKYREAMDRENKHRHDKQHDERPAKDHTSNRPDDKHAREEKDNVDSRQKRTKLPESDRDRERKRDRDGEQDLESSRDRERHHARDRAHDRDRDHDYDLDRDRDYDRDRNWDWDIDRDLDRDQDRDRDRDGSHADDRSARSKEIGAKKRTWDERDDYSDTKSRVVKIHYSDAEKRSLSSSRADSDADRGKSQPRQSRADSIGTSSKRRSSPTSNAHIGKDEYRNVNSEDMKFRDSMIEQRTKGLREGFSGMSKHKSMENPIKIDDGHVADLSTERSSSSKASPMGLVERSPSSASIERKYMNRSGVRQGLEFEESGQRNNTDARDFSASEDRLGRELTLEKSLLDDFSQADSSFYGRTSQGNVSLIPTPPAFRAGLDRPFMGSLEDDVRDNSNPRYRRNSDPGFGRGHGNSWRGVPNWTLRVPNGFVPFQHGPTHGGFQAMIPQFPSQPLFAVRPPMEVNRAGIPYHIPDGDRFSGHMRPLGWQNMMDGTGPSHFHGWDGNNGVFRDDPHIYGGSDWDRNRHLTNSRGWESGSEAWKEQNGDLRKDLPSSSQKDESVLAQVDEVDDSLTEQVTHTSQDEHNWGGVHEKAPETKLSSFSSPAKVPMNSSPTITPEKVPDTSTPSDNTSLLSRFYVSKLDISVELALPELYDQCMCLLNVEKNACIDSHASTDLFLKNGSRARQKYAATLSKPSPFPAIDSSMFQRAIDLYRKQRAELPNRGKVDIFSVVNQVQVDEPIPTPSLENMQVSSSTDDATPNMPIATSDLKKVEKLSQPANKHLEESDQTLRQKGQDHVCAHSFKLVMSGPPGHENQGEPLAGLRETEDEVTSEQVILGDVENHHIAVINESKLVSTTHEGGDNMISKAKITGFAHCGDEKLGFGDTMGRPLIFDDGTPKACDTLMPESNESESLILSRIHHSPESTH